MSEEQQKELARHIAVSILSAAGAGRSEVMPLEDLECVWMDVLEEFISPWISVEEDKPTLFRSVLVIDLQSPNPHATITYACRGPFGFWQDANDKRKSDYTHWLPLPKLPQE